MPSFDTVVSYSQIAVFNSDMENPFNDWNDAQVRQGFSWRPGSISFRTIVDGAMRVEFVVASEFRSLRDSMRTISVPFTCNDGGKVEVATITDAHPISLERGQYQLVFETGPTGGGSWCRLSMIPNGLLEPMVLVADSELAPAHPLVMDARGA